LRAKGFESVDFGLPCGQPCPQRGDFGFQPIDLGQAGVGLLPGGAADAALLYDETEESRARRTVLAAEMKALPAPRFKGRPTKKSRRDYEKWLRSSDDE